MNEKPNVRDSSVFHERYAAYIEKGLSAKELYAALQKDFPNAEVPTISTVTTWTSSAVLWRELIEHFGRERAEQLWGMNQSRIRALGRENFRPQTLEEKVHIPTSATLRHSTPGRRYGSR